MIPAGSPVAPAPPESPSIPQVALELAESATALSDLGAVLGVVAPAESIPRNLSGVPSVELPVAAIGSPRMEVWRSQGPVSRVDRGPICGTTSPDLLFGFGRAQLDGDLQQCTFDLFTGILELAESEGRPHLVRAWNYFPRINEVESIERYGQFCVGRYEAFERAGLDMTRDLPAGSAVGSRQGDLVVVFIASKHRPRYVENPRQMSAFVYPRQYGPRSPSFARAALLDDERTLFISGTASIVGHETVHVGKTTEQVDETLRNLDAVIANAFGSGHSLASPELDRRLRVYIRHESDHPIISARLEKILPPERIAYLHADICRSNLLVEIEAFVQRTD